MKKPRRFLTLSIGDLLLSCALLVLGLAGVFLLQSEGDRVVIKHRDETVYEGSLQDTKELTVSGDFENVIRIENGRVWYVRSTCPGQDCVHMGARSSSGGALACAPNATLVMIRGEEAVDGVVR